MSEEMVVRRLDSVVRLLALLLIQGKKRVEAIAVLSAAGFQPKDIATLLGTTGNSVRVALSNLRKNKANRSATLWSRGHEEE
ncbi:MAG: hypothetical protein ACRD2L_04335 [Terriglobia bacterium]